LNHDFRLDFGFEKNSLLIRLGRGGGSGAGVLANIRENRDLFAKTGSGAGEGTGSGAGLENIREKKLLELTTSEEFCIEGLATRRLPTVLNLCDRGINLVKRRAMSHNFHINLL